MIRTEKPSEIGTELRTLETIPTPAAQDVLPGPVKTPAAVQSPTLAPLNSDSPVQIPSAAAPSGPAVEPAPPAASLKDVPASETSRRLLRMIPPVAGHTT